MDFSKFSINNIIDLIKYKKNVIGISITSRSMLEVIEYDYENNKINNYTNVGIQYNNFTRQIENIGELEFLIKKALEDLGTRNTSTVYLSLPTVLMGHLELISTLDSDSIRFALSAEAEKNYIFKRSEPVVAYNTLYVDENTSMAKIAYTALPAEQLQQIKDILTNIGLNVVAIDTSYTSMIRGIITAKKVPENILNEDATWNIVDVTQNSYLIFSMQGDKILNIFEEPLAIKSYAEDEIYNVISSSARANLQNFPASYTVIVSESDDVSAELFADNLGLDTQFSYVENNKFNRSPIVECGLNVLQSKAPNISLEAIGAAMWNDLNVASKFNFIETEIAPVDEISSIVIMGKEYDPKTLLSFAIGCLIFVCILSGLLYLTTSGIQNMKNKEHQELKDRVSEIESRVKAKPKQQGVSVNEFVNRTFDLNKNMLKSFEAISYEIPEKLWLEEFNIGMNLSFYAKGRAYTVNDILSYYESLRKIGRFQNLKISTLTVSDVSLTTQENDASKTIEDKTYEFVFGEKQIAVTGTEDKEVKKSKRMKRRIRLEDEDNKDYASSSRRQELSDESESDLPPIPTE